MSCEQSVCNSFLFFHPTTRTAGTASGPQRRYRRRRTLTVEHPDDPPLPHAVAALCRVLVTALAVLASRRLTRHPISLIHLVVMGTLHWRKFLSSRDAAVLRVEVLWLWIPTLDHGSVMWPNRGVWAMKIRATVFQSSHRTSISAVSLVTVNR